jgi:putative drug exporter of the RND superfamily
MSSLLYHLGGWAFRRRRLVAAAWLAVLVTVAALAAGIKGDTTKAFNVPGTESQRALDLLDAKFPGTGGATARIVFAAPKGHTLDEPRYRNLNSTIALAQKVPQSVGGGRAFRSSAQMSKDKTIAFADLHFAVPVDKLEDSTKDALRDGPRRRGDGRDRRADRADAAVDVDRGRARHVAVHVVTWPPPCGRGSGSASRGPWWPCPRERSSG